MFLLAERLASIHPNLVLKYEVNDQNNHRVQAIWYDETP